MSEERARYGRMPKAYTVSEDTSDMLDVIAAFDDVGEMLVGALVKRYGISADRMMDDYYEAAGDARDFLFHLLRDSIENQMGSVGSSMI